MPKRKCYSTLTLRRWVLILSNPIKIVLRYPFMDLNTFINLERTNRYKGADAKKKQTNIAYALLPKIKLSPPVHIVYNWYVKNKRKDLDNIAFAKKFINDGIVKKGLLPNDGWQDIAGFTDNFFVDKNERVELLIYQASDMVAGGGIAPPTSRL